MKNFGVTSRVLSAVCNLQRFSYKQRDYSEIIMDLDGVDQDEEIVVPAYDSIQPYQFEPIARSRNQDGNVHESEESSDHDEADDMSSVFDEQAEVRTDNLAWCDCENCQSMPTNEECLCCREVPPVDEKVDSEGLTCITEHEGFVGNCLNRHVVETAIYDYVEMNGPVDDNEPINELYRYVAYRQFTKWVWHRLGRNRRKVIPACSVKAIREAYPSEEYTGFKYARP